MALSSSLPRVAGIGSRAPAWLSAPAALGLVVAFLVPIGFFAVYSVLTAGLYSVSGPLTLENYRSALSSGLNRTLATNSLVVGLSTAAVCVILGLAVAYWLTFAAGRWQRVVLFLVVASMFASYLVRIYAWRTILGENGVLNTGLEALGLTGHPLGFLIFSRFAVTIALVHILLPYVILLLFAGFRPISAALLESAEDLGATARQRWQRVILPLIAAPAVSAFLFVFVLAASDYVTPQFLGGTNGSMIGVQVEASFVEVGNWPLGAATGFAMLGGFIICYFVAVGALRVLKLNRIEWR